MSPRSSLSERAYTALRQLLVTLELRPGELVREDELRVRLGIGRTPIREAIQRLAREQFLTVVARRGVFVTDVTVGDLALLFETRAVLEPYAARLAAARGTDEQWDEMAAALGEADPSSTPQQLLDIDGRCHRLIWAAAGNRFLTDTLDTLYAQSDRVWHLYLAGVADMAHAVDEHRPILAALRTGDGDRAAELSAQHVRAFDAEIRAVVTALLSSPARLGA